MEVCFEQKAVVQGASFKERKVAVVKESDVAVRDSGLKRKGTRKSSRV